MRIGIIAALPGELKPLVKGWRRMPSGASNLAVWQRPGDRDVVLAACAGMGGEPARRAFSALEAFGTLDLVISMGWSGALSAEFAAGACELLSEVIDAQTGERFALDGATRELRLVTTVRVANAPEKKRLRESYEAVMVDMEAATVARLGQMRGIPVICVKAVSDGIDARLPDMNPYIGRDGQMRMAAFLGHVLLRPWLWPELIRLGGHSAEAARRMAARVKLLIAERTGLSSSKLEDGL